MPFGRHYNQVNPSLHTPGSMLVNFLWPRSATNPAFDSLAGFPVLGALGSIPIFDATLGVIVVVCAIYYFVALRGSPDAPQVLPAPGAAASA